MTTLGHYCSNIYSELELGPDAVVGLVGRDGIVRARNAVEGEAVGADVMDAQRLASQLSIAPSGSFATDATQDPVPRFYSYRALDAYPLVVLLGTSQAAALLDHEKNSDRYEWVAAVATVIIVLIGLSVAWQTRRAALGREFQHRKDMAVAQLLRATTDGMQTAQRIAKLGSWELNRVTGELMCSDELFRMFEVDRPQAGARYEAFLDAVHPDDRAMVDSTYSESLANREAFELTHRLRMRDGRIKWVSSHCTSDFDANGKLLRSVGTVQDITERKQMEDKLVDSKSRLNNIIAHEPECIKILDAQGRLQMMNPAGLAMLEVDTLEQAVGMQMQDVIAPEFRASFQDLHQRVLSGETLQMEFKVIGLKGGHRWVETHAVPLTERGETVHLAVTRDITERMRALEQQRIAAATFELQQSLMITDASAVILKVNRAFTLTTGYTAEEALGQTPRMLQSGRHDRDFYRAMWESIQSTGGWQGEIWDQHKNGQVYPKWLTISAVVGCDGSVSHYIGSHVDITKRKNAEAAMQVLNQELSQSRQQLRELAAQNEAALEAERKHIAREVHDELGQVLTALRMDMSLLSMRFGSLEPALDEKVTDMKVLVDRAIRGVRDVAANLRPAALDMGLVPAIEWLCHEFTEHSGVACTFHPPEENLEVNASRAVVIFRIVQESLTNISRYARASQVSISMARRDNALWVAVRDNGIGFDKVTTAKRKSFGLLGMRERAIALGGRVTIATALDQGTVVDVVIPIDSAMDAKV